LNYEQGSSGPSVGCNFGRYRRDDRLVQAQEIQSLGDCLAMSHSVTVRPKQRPAKPPNLIYSFPNAAAWMQ